MGQLFGLWSNRRMKGLCCWNFDLQIYNWIFKIKNHFNPLKENVKNCCYRTTGGSLNWINTIWSLYYQDENLFSKVSNKRSARRKYLHMLYVLYSSTTHFELLKYKYLSNNVLHIKFLKSTSINLITHSRTNSMS